MLTEPKERIHVISNRHPQGRGAENQRFYFQELWVYEQCINCAYVELRALIVFIQSIAKITYSNSGLTVLLIKTTAGLKPRPRCVTIF